MSEQPTIHRNLVETWVLRGFFAVAFAFLLAFATGSGCLCAKRAFGIDPPAILISRR